MYSFFFFNDTATTEIYTLSLHDALPIYVGPHTYYALPGRMLVQALSNTRDKGGVTGMALYNNKGDFITSYAMPVANGGGGEGHPHAGPTPEKHRAPPPLRADTHNTSTSCEVARAAR